MVFVVGACTWFECPVFLDMFGYEGLAETVTSTMLTRTNLAELGFRYVSYRMERMEVHGRTRNGCSSVDFLQSGESILTLADLLHKGVGPEWQIQVKRLPNMQAKIGWLIEQTERLTGLDRFGAYLTALFEADMLFGNEDRHLNNIAVLRRGEAFDYCPMFDFGTGLLSNVHDYPMDAAPKALLSQLRAQPMNAQFIRQVHAAQAIYGTQLRCDFSREDVVNALAEPLMFYAERDQSYISDRVLRCVQTQYRKLKK